MLSSLLTVTLLTLSAPPVELRPLEGPPVAGELQSLNTEQVVVELSGAAAAESPSPSQTVATESLLHVRPQAAEQPAEAKPSVWLELVDGSTLQGTAYTVSASAAELTLLSGRAVTMPTRAIKWVRFAEQSEELARAWREITSAPTEGDRLVVRRRVQQPAEAGGAPRVVESLDSLSGVLHDITGETLAFEFGGDRIEVRREKAEGLVYFHPAGRTLPAPRCLVQTVDGDQWKVRSIELVDDQLQLVSVAGVKHTLPWTSAALLDFSAGKILYLSDLEPQLSEWVSFFGGKNEPSSLKQLFSPRRDRGFDGGPLQLGGENYAKGLALHSRSVLEYRLPDNFRRLAAVAGIDDSLGDNGHVILRISGDRRPLLEKPIAGNQEQPLKIDLDVEGVRLLRIEVDFGDNLDIADHLYLGDIRVMK